MGTFFAEETRALRQDGSGNPHQWGLLDLKRRLGELVKLLLKLDGWAWRSGRPSGKGKSQFRDAVVEQTWAFYYSNELLTEANGVRAAYNTVNAKRFKKDTPIFVQVTGFLKSGGRDGFPKVKSLTEAFVRLMALACAPVERAIAGIRERAGFARVAIAAGAYAGHIYVGARRQHNATDDSVGFRQLMMHGTLADTSVRAMTWAARVGSVAGHIAELDWPRIGAQLTARTEVSDKDKKRVLNHAYYDLVYNAIEVVNAAEHHSHYLGGHGGAVAVRRGHLPHQPGVDGRGHEIHERYYRLADHLSFTKERGAGYFDRNALRATWNHASALSGPPVVPAAEAVEEAKHAKTVMYTLTNPKGTGHDKAIGYAFEARCGLARGPEHRRVVLLEQLRELVQPLQPPVQTRHDRRGRRGLARRRVPRLPVVEILTDDRIHAIPGLLLPHASERALQRHATLCTHAASLRCAASGHSSSPLVAAAAENAPSPTTAAATAGLAGRRRARSSAARSSVIDPKRSRGCSASPRRSTAITRRGTLPRCSMRGRPRRTSSRCLSTASASNGRTPNSASQIETHSEN